MENYRNYQEMEIAERTEEFYEEMAKEEAVAEQEQEEEETEARGICEESEWIEERERIVEETMKDPNHERGRSTAEDIADDIIWENAIWEARKRLGRSYKNK